MTADEAPIPPHSPAPAPTGSRWVVAAQHAGGRLDTYLADRLHLSREEVRRLLARRGVRMNGSLVPARGGGERLAAGAVLLVEPVVTVASAAVIAQPEAALVILAQGPGWVVVDKPAGTPVHPLEPDERNTLLNALIARHPEIHGVGEGGLRSGVVHRLDVETSGCLAFGLDQPTWQTLRDAFRLHHTRKTYRAIVRGRLAGAGGESLDLVIAQHRPAKVRVVEAGSRQEQARRCDLAWRAIESFPPSADSPAATLLEVDLGTGFLHQIRVMLAHLGHPVLGDALYGEGPTPLAPRPLLHAAALSAGPASATSPDPADFAEALRRLLAR